MADVPAISRIVECEYQVPGALVSFLSGPQAPGRAAAAVIPAIEYAVEAAADAAALLGLPGLTPEAAGVFRDKYRLRQLAESAGLRNPRHTLVDDPEAAKAFLAAVGGRCVLKPTTRQGSLGVQHIESPAEIDAGWTMTAVPVGGAVIPERGIPSRVLMEQAVTGPEFSVEMLVSGGAVCFANVTAKHLFGGRFPVERGHDVPASLPIGDGKLLVEATIALAEAAGVSDAILHAEWILHDGEPVLVECAARIPGGQITRLIRLASDFPLIPAYLEVMLGDRPAASPVPLRGAAIRYLTAPPGTVADVAGEYEAARMPGVIDVRITSRSGSRRGPVMWCGR